MQRFRRALVFITLVTCGTFSPRGAVAFDDSIPPDVAEVHLPIPAVQHFAELIDGTIALGSSEGLGLWHNGKLQLFTGKDSNGPMGPNSAVKSDLPGSRIDCLHSGRDGSLWIGTNQGLARYRQGKLEDVSPKIRKILDDNQPMRQKNGLDLNVMSLFEASNGKIWIGLRYGNLIVYSPDRDLFELIEWAPDIELPKKLDPNNWIRNVVEDTDKNVWVVVAGMNVFQIHFMQFTDVPAEKKRWTAADDVRDLCFDLQGNTWIATLNGVTVCRPDGSSRHFTRKDGLPADFVHDIYEVSPGRISMSTMDNGACIYDGKRFVYPISDSLKNEAFQTLFRLKNAQYWISDWQEVVGNVNVTWVDESPMDRSIASIKARVENEYPFVGTARSVATDEKGNVWTVIRNRLFRFDGKIWTAIPELAPPSISIHRIKATSKGRILVATSHGLLMFASNSKKTLIPNDGTASGYVYDMAEDRDGTIYVGTQGGLFRIKGEQTEPITANRQFQAVVVTVDEQGVVWFADANAGLFRYSGQGIDSFTDEPSLAGLSIGNLQPRPVTGIRIVAYSGGLTGVIVKTIEFDGNKFKEIAQPKSIVGVEGHSNGNGFQIDEVAPGSAAELAWLSVGDTIVDVNGQPIGSIEELDQALRGLKPQKEGVVGISRKGRAIKVKMRTPLTP